jgi:hypothetical protein
MLTSTIAGMYRCVCGKPVGSASPLEPSQNKLSGRSARIFFPQIGDTALQSPCSTVGIKQLVPWGFVVSCQLPAVQLVVAALATTSASLGAAVSKKEVQQTVWQ